MQKTPKVSIVIPTYNRAKELPKSINSVLCQSYRNFELIIIDDASTDNTEEVVKSFEDQRIRYEKLTNNVGGAEARNIGVRLARGEVIAFQDSDDEWTCTKLERSLKELDPEDVGAVFTTFIRLWDSGCILMPVARYKFRQENAYESLLFQNHVGTPTLVVKKKIFDKVGGFDPLLPRYQDWDLALKLSQATKLKIIKEPTLIAHTTQGSISHNNKALYFALNRIYDLHRSTIEKNRSLKAAWLYMLGCAQFSNGDVSGRFSLLKAFMIRPLNKRHAIMFILSLPGSPRLYNYIISTLK